jgi:hypothetical protein
MHNKGRTTIYALQSNALQSPHYNLRTANYAPLFVALLVPSLPTHYAIHTLHKFKKKFVVKKH